MTMLGEFTTIASGPRAKCTKVRSGLLNGNYVSIETLRGYVILAHLKKGSIEILPGTPVRACETIGRCGNSGNTRGAHLHVHAQNRAQMAVDVAEGIPIAFLDGAGQPMILEYGDLLGPSIKLQGACRAAMRSRRSAR
jgi:murein DD-endopeptidase MepM/ murein hydrolase activator NlpD